jgi:hypothetical protein
MEGVFLSDLRSLGFQAVYQHRVLALCHPFHISPFSLLTHPTHFQTRCLRAEFDEYDDSPIPVIHYQHKGEWYAKVGLTGSPQKLNMRGIQQHVRKWLVQKRTRGHLRKSTYETLPEAQRKRDKLFG